MCGTGDDCNRENHCGCHDQGPRIEGFIMPCLLLILKEQPIHGYEIMEKLNNLPYLDTVPDPGVIYRHLRRMEEEGKVESQLEPGSGGPARKVYTLTPDGEKALGLWAAKIRRRRASMKLFLEAFKQRCPGS